MIRVYVAGAWIERETRAIPVIKALREAGVTITHDWTLDSNEVSNAATSDSELAKEYRLEHAKLDQQGVFTADYVLLLAPTERGASGAWTEFGMALGKGIPVIVAGGQPRCTLFTELAIRIFDTDAEGVAFLTEEH